MSPRSSSPRTLLLVSATLIALLLAGCIGSAPAETDPGDDLPDEDDLPGNKTNNSTVDIWDPTAEQDPNSTFHVHDYWGDREEIVIAREITVPGPDPEDFAVSSAQKLSPQRSGLIEFAIPIDENAEQPKYVYPGTTKMEVELDWTVDPAPVTDTLTQLTRQSDTGLNDQSPVIMCVNNFAAEPTSPCIQHYRTPESPNQGFNDSKWFDEPGTWVMEGEDNTGSALFSPKTWDVPHTQKSKWRWALLAETCGQGIAKAGCLPAFDIEEFTIKMTIFRGRDLPMDPPHLDYYRDSDTVTLLPESTLDGDEVPIDCYNADVGSHDLRGTTLWAGEEFRDRKTPICSFGGSIIHGEYVKGTADAPVVPPSTEEVRFHMSWDDNAQDPVDLHIGYRDAMTNWDEEWNYLHQADGDCSGTDCTWTIGLDNAKHADSLYAVQSVWEFGIFIESQGQNQPTYPMDSLNVQASLVASETVSA